MNNQVLIGITTRNRESILPKAIHSALSQDYLEKIVAVFDDASTDGTGEIQYRFPQVIWKTSPIAKGLVYARNLFLELADTAYFCSLDDDAWFLKENSLSKAIDLMDANPDVGAIAFEILSPDRNTFNEYKEVFPKETNRYVGCGHILRISAAKAVGKYIRTPGYYGSEEKDLCIRLIDAGYRIIKMEGLYVWHDKTPLSRDIQLQHRSGVCNDLVFMWRRTPLLYLIPSFFVKIFKQFVFSFSNKERNLLKPFYLGLLDFIKFLFKKEVGRSPVSMKAFRKYLSFN